MYRIAIMRDEKYTIDLFDTKEEAEAELPKVKKRWGQGAYVEEATDNGSPK